MDITERRLAERILIWHAQGIVMAYDECGPEEAMAAMSRRAECEGRTLAAVGYRLIREHERRAVSDALVSYRRSTMSSSRGV